MKQIVTIFISIFIFSSSGQGFLNVNSPEKPPQKVALEFYNWYLKKYLLFKSDPSHPDLKLVKSTYQIISKDQFDKLKETGFFSNEFYRNQIAIYSACDVKLRRVNVKEVEQCACSPTEFVKGNECDFMTFYPWIGGQGEQINTAKIIKVNTTGNLSKVTIGLSADKYPYSRPEVTLLKEDGNWKILKIELRY